MSKYFDSSILFDYFLFPILCVFYNRTSEKSNLQSIFVQSFMYSTPMTVLEVILEKKTKLIRYNKNWNWFITYLTLVVTFLFIRGFIAIIRKLNIEKYLNPKMNNSSTMYQVRKRFMNLYSPTHRFMNLLFIKFQMQLVPTKSKVQSQWMHYG